MQTESIAATATAYTAAWNSGSAEAVASFYAETGDIVINRGTPWEGRAGVQAMAEGFFADVPDLTLTCDGVRIAGDHVVYLWTFTGHHAETRNPLRITGWEGMGYRRRRQGRGLPRVVRRRRLRPSGGGIRTPCQRGDSSTCAANVT